MTTDLRHVQVIERVRKAPGKPCKHCGKPIDIGAEFVSIVLNTGFTNAPVGNFHKDCWTDFKPGLGKHLAEKWAHYKSK